MRLRWSNDALADRDKIALYIAEHDPAAAERVLDRITEALNVLEAHPFAGRTGLVADTRELVIPQTRYIGVYRIEDGHPVILRIMHSSQQWPPTEDS